MRAKQFNELLNSVRSLTQTQQSKLIGAALKASAIDHTVAAASERMTPEYLRPHCNSLTGTPLARPKQDIARACLNLKAGTSPSTGKGMISTLNAHIPKFLPIGKILERALPEGIVNRPFSDRPAVANTA